MTPIKVPDRPTPDALAKHIASLADRISKVLLKPGQKSVTSVDKKEILTLTQAITDATTNISTVMDAQTTVSNISATDLLSSVKEEIDKLRKDLTVQHNASTSYAAVASKPSTRTKTPVTRPAIVISAVDANHKHSDVLDTWRKSVSFKDATFAPARVQNVSNNKVRIEFDDAQQRSNIINKLKSVASLKVEEARRRRPMMILKGIHKSTARDELPALIREQNPTVKASTSADKDIRVCFLRNNRNDNLFNAVIEVTPDARLSLLSINRVNVDHQRVHVSDFSPFVQCFKCLQFGHTKAKCQSSVEPCSHCASDAHTYQNCPNKSDASKVRCFNCHQHNVKTNSSVNDAHSATSINKCPRIKALQQRINERVDYGC
jgi:hypothetical protein